MKPFLIILGVPLACIAIALLTGCGEPHIYLPTPEPTCTELVTDECVEDVVAEFCEWPESGTVCLPIDSFNEAKQAAYDRGFNDGVDASFEGSYYECNTALNECRYDLDACEDYNECPVPDVVEPGDDGYCDLSIPVGHRPIECRGNNK